MPQAARRAPYRRPPRVPGKWPGASPQWQRPELATGKYRPGSTATQARRQFAQLPGIAGVCPEQDARVQAAGLIPLFPRGDPPGTGYSFPRPAACSNRLRPSVAAPAKPDRQNRRHAAGAHGSVPPVPGSDEGPDWPVFPTGGFIHGRPGGNRLGRLPIGGRGHRPGGHGFLCPHGQRASPRERAIRAASELGKSASRVRYFWAAPGLSPRRLRLMPALSRASAFL